MKPLVLILLLGTHNGDIWVNPDHIVRMFMHDGRCTITMTDGTPLWFRDKTCKQVMQDMAETKQRELIEYSMRPYTKFRERDN